MSDYQVGVSSTAIYEGLEFGLETYIYKIKTSECMKALCEDHYACYITSPQELYMQIRDKNTIKNSHGRSEFWKKNALQNMEREIDNILP